MFSSQGTFDSLGIKIKEICPSSNVQLDYNLAKHTTYKVGGNASIYCEADNIEDLSSIIKLANNRNIDYFILGGGSNLLISDNGYTGLVIKLGIGFKNVDVDPDKAQIISGGSVSLSRVANIAKKNSFAGLEFSAGTPGSIGGAVKMNAGTATDWIGSRISWIKIVKSDGQPVVVNGDEINWGYRKTSLNDADIVVEACLKLSKSKSPELIEKTMSEIIKRRHNNQPLGAKTCGCSFVNPPQHSAGLLIEKSGLKGKQIGGAKVSEIHANFIVNNGGATSDDIVELMRLIQFKVYEKFDVKLHTEVKFVGFDGNPTLY